MHLETDCLGCQPILTTKQLIQAYLSAVTIDSSTPQTTKFRTGYDPAPAWSCSCHHKLQNDTMKRNPCLGREAFKIENMQVRDICLLKLGDT
jgi:hypothetical protein